MTETIVIRRVGLTVELLLHKRHGIRGRELLEKTLDMNPGLAALGPELPLGTAVKIPSLPPASKQPVKVITLFG